MTTFHIALAIYLLGTAWLVVEFIRAPYADQSDEHGYVLTNPDGEPLQ